jgi:hypothetical protein
MAQPFFPHWAFREATEKPRLFAAPPLERPVT